MTEENIPAVSHAIRPLKAQQPGTSFGGVSQPAVLSTVNVSDWLAQSFWHHIYILVACLCLACGPQTKGDTGHSNSSS